MLGLGPIAFAAPWVLTALVALPVLWWLLRLTPPAPRRLNFPAIRLLRDLVAPEETPARTPWWLLLLRVLAVIVVVLALAGPVLNPGAGVPGSGPMVLVVDNGWAAGRDWEARRHVLDDLVNQAERHDRPVVLLTTAPLPGAARPVAQGPMAAAEARRLVQALEPQPWPGDRAGALEALRGLALKGAVYGVWVSDGLGDARQTPGGAAYALAETLQRMGGVEVLDDSAERPVHLLRPPTTDGAGLAELTVRVVRADPKRPEPVTVRLTGPDGRYLERETATFEAGQRLRDIRFTIPVELRNEAAALRIENESTAGAVVLLDERWRRRPVGLVSGRAEDASQPLLSDLYYLHRALEPYTEVRSGGIADLLRRELSMLVLPDIGSLTGAENDAIEAWVRHGGLLLRFAGPRLAQNADALVPVRLRLGDRTLGGALSWVEPAHLQPFDGRSPFAGLPIPGEVAVRRQVLAEPSLDLADRTWARLADGTPLVTSDKRGDGWVVLVHTTAGPEWSNLPLSGLFVEMLRRLTALSAGVGGMSAAEGRTVALEPVEVLDGRGRPGAPPATALPLAGDAIVAESLDSSHPPGFYGTPDTRRALNLSSRVTDIRPLTVGHSGGGPSGGLPPGVRTARFGESGEVALKPSLLALALALAAADLVIALALRGLLRPAGRRAGRRGPGAAAVSTAVSTILPAMLLVLLLPVAGARAQNQGSDARALRVTEETHLAYVQTGDPTVDATARAGLEGLVEVLSRRTAVEAAGALGVDVEADELAFFPMLYWPMSPAQPPLSEQARARINLYLRNGGLIVFDTRDQAQGAALTGAGAGSQTLRRLADGLDIPALAPVPADHVLTKSFYLIHDFPGRTAGGTLWAEAREGRINDGVSSVIVGGNDWAAAWAVDRTTGQPLHPVVPGGERQREMAFRFGVNLVVYALTGNYKADQVHVPAILERLGQ
jgi:hypothetical protein